MGVILKVLHRSETLKKAPHRNLFLDMEENIHIHYRDLRVELSRAEFEDFVNTFTKQSAELMQAIRDTDYQDGVLPNANHDALRIWTDSRLANDVVYHPRRISVEECTDGFHVHLRNYKLLLDTDDFRVLADAFRTMDLDAPYATGFEEVLELLDANDLHYNVDAAHGDERRLTVARYHEPKVRPILTGIGMARTARGGQQIYRKGDLVIAVTFSSDRADFQDRFEGAPRTYAALTDVLTARRAGLDRNWLNGVKAKVLDTFALVRRADAPPTVNLDYRSWLHDRLYDDVVFPFDPSPGDVDPDRAYRAWSDFLKSVDMYFVKPSKVLFKEAKQQALYASVLERVDAVAAAVPAVSRIWIMGSAMNGTMGFYKVPFIHSEWAKLGSDVDLLIEIDETDEFEPPETWRYINVSSTNGCAIYHIDQIPFSDVLGHRKRYPHIAYFDHLVDAYVYFPAKGNRAAKDAFLEKFKARLLFDRDRDDRIRETLRDRFGAAMGSVRKLDVASENDIYEVDVDGRTDILKVYRVSGNYRSSRLADHTRYEADLVRALTRRGADIAPLHETSDGEAVFHMDGAPAVLFARLAGEEVAPPDMDVEACAAALAGFHDLQAGDGLGLETDFSFDHTFDIWHGEFDRFAGTVEGDDDLTAAFDNPRGIHLDLETTHRRLRDGDGLVRLHNHGDVQPRNMILCDGRPWLFDLQNAFFGPRLLDIVEGGIEFSWGIRDPDHNDFARYGRFVAAYGATSPLNAHEQAGLDAALQVVGTIKFVKEVRMIKGSTNPDNLRRRRALDLAAFMTGGGDAT